MISSLFRVEVPIEQSVEARNFAEHHMAEFFKGLAPVADYYALLSTHEVEERIANFFRTKDGNFDPQQAKARSENALAILAWTIMFQPYRTGQMRTNEDIIPPLVDAVAATPKAFYEYARHIFITPHYGNYLTLRSLDADLAAEYFNHVLCYLYANPTAVQYVADVIEFTDMPAETE